MRELRGYMFDVHFGSQHIVLWRAIDCLSCFLMAGREYDTTKKLYAIPTRINVSAILIFCFIVVEQATRSLHCLIILVVVVYICVSHFSEGARFIPRYVYGLFLLNTCIGLFM